MDVFSDCDWFSGWPGCFVSGCAPQTVSVIGTCLTIYLCTSLCTCHFVLRVTCKVVCSPKANFYVKS